MGNEYKVTVKGDIRCECGGQVTLASTNKNMTIKPVQIQDILNAPISGCGNSKDKCTSVASINLDGTIERETGSDGKTFLYRTDGFTTNKGRKVILHDPGQNVVKGTQTVSKENEVSHYIPEILEKKEVLKEYKCKYRLYLLRQSSKIDEKQEEQEELIKVYKPIKASRNFVKSYNVFNKTANLDDVPYNKEDEEKYDSINFQLLAFVYVVEKNKLQVENKLQASYQIFTKGSVNSYKLTDVRYKNLDTKDTSRYIPLQENNVKSAIYDIYYSNVRLEKLKDIEQLPKLQINTNENSFLEEKNATYVEDIENSAINSISLNVNHFKLIEIPDGKSHYNIVGVVEDKVGEIDDLYDIYYTRFIHNHLKNKEIFENVKDRNQYIYFVSNLIGNYYVNEEKAESRNEKIKSLEYTYRELVNTLIEVPVFQNYLIDKISKGGIVNCLSEEEEIVLEYFNQVTYRKKDFFESVCYGYYRVNLASLRFYYIAPNNLKLSKYIYIDRFDLKNSKSGYKNYNTPFELLALLVFSTFFIPNEELEEDYKKYGIEKLKFEFLSKLSKIEPMLLKKDKEEEIRDLIDDQDVYKDLISRNENKFLDEFEQLDYYLDLSAFEKSKRNFIVEFFSNNNKIKTKDLYISNDNLVVDNYITPKIILTEICKKLKLKLKLKELTNLLKIYTNIQKSDKEYILTLMNISLILHSPRVNLDEEMSEISFFKDEYKESRLLIQKALEGRIDIASEIEDYEVNKVFDTMLFKTIAYEYVINTKGKSLNEFLDIAKDIKFKKEFYTQDIKGSEDSENPQEKLYKFFTLITNITNEVNENVKNSNVASNVEKGKKVEVDVKEGVENKTAKKLNITAQGLSFFLAIINLPRLFTGKESVTIKSVVGLASDIVTITAITTEALIKPADITKVEFFQKHLSKLKSLNAVSIKIATTSVIPVVIISGIYDGLKRIKDGNLSAGAFTFAKTFLVARTLLLRLVFFKITLLIIALELAEYIFMDMLEDTKIEKYIKNSLLFNDSDKYKANILNETIEISNRELNNNEFTSFNDIKKFIGSNYDANKTLFDTALLNELNSFHRTLENYEIKGTSDRNKKIKIGRSVNVNIQTSIKIKDTKNAGSIKVFLYDDVDLKYVVAKCVLKNDNYLYYDCITDLLEKKITQLNTREEVKKEVEKDYYLILSNNMTLKYKINLNLHMIKSLNTYITIEINEIKDELLSNQDYEAIEILKRES